MHLLSFYLEPLEALTQTEHVLYLTKEKIYVPDGEIHTKLVYIMV